MPASMASQKKSTRALQGRTCIDQRDGHIRAACLLEQVWPQLSLQKDGGPRLPVCKERACGSRCVEGRECEVAR